MIDLLRTRSGILTVTAYSRTHWDNIIEYERKISSIPAHDMQRRYMLYLQLRMFSINVPVIKSIKLAHRSVNVGSLNSLGKHKEAIECFDKALKLNPNSVTDWIDKGAAFVELGKYDEAIDFLDKALSIDPNNVDTLSHKGASLANSEKYEEAIEYFDKALAIDPNNAEVSKSKEIALKLKEKEQI